MCLVTYFLCVLLGRETTTNLKTEQPTIKHLITYTAPSTTTASIPTANRNIIPVAVAVSVSVSLLIVMIAAVLILWRRHHTAKDEASHAISHTHPHTQPSADTHTYTSIPPQASKGRAGPHEEEVEMRE